MNFGPYRRYRVTRPLGPASFLLLFFLSPPPTFRVTPHTTTPRTHLQCQSSRSSSSAMATSSSSPWCDATGTIPDLSCATAHHRRDPIRRTQTFGTHPPSPKSILTSRLTVWTRRRSSELGLPPCPSLSAPRPSTRRALLSSSWWRIYECPANTPSSSRCFQVALPHAPDGNPPPPRHSRCRSRSSTVSASGCTPSRYLIPPLHLNKVC